jgi:hypothetical protein
MDAGVERIVDQVVNPKIRSLVEPEVERIICNYLGVEKLEQGGGGDEGEKRKIIAKRLMPSRADRKACRGPVLQR